MWSSGRRPRALAGGLAIAMAANAWAQEAVGHQVDVRAKADIGRPGAYASGGGLAVRGGWRAVGRLWLEGGVDAVVLADGGARLSLAPGLRVFITPDTPMKPALSVMAGVGIDVHTAEADTPTVRPIFGGEAAFDLPVHDAWSVRLAAGYESNGAPWSAATFGVGVRWRPVRYAPEPEPEPVVVPEPPRELWLPYPYCAWSDAETAARTIADLESRRPDDPSAPEEPASPNAPAKPESAKQAAIVVLGEAGDVVIVDGVSHTLPGDGALKLTRQPGEVRVQAWGRLYPPADPEPSLFAPATPDGDDVWPLAEGEILWVRIPTPDVVLVHFDVDSSLIPESTTLQLLDVVTRTGDWTWGVSGSFSPEGGLDHNLQLAERRARAVIAFLAERGVAPSALRYEDPRPPEPGLTPEEQRSVVLRPIPPGGG